ncbi:fibronectin type III domain-containing protein [Patescibacteria group bacterium]|nr:fibronectin type III domain-containing protein [Patescibacteria group bacterium]
MKALSRGIMLGIVIVLGLWFLQSRERGWWVRALNYASNWNFNGNANGWSSTNGNGTDTCGATTSSAENAMASVGYNANLAGQGAYQAVTASGQNVIGKAMIYQTFIAPGTGTVKAKGQFDYYGNSTYWSTTANSSWIRLDLYDATNTNFVSNLGCISFNTNQAWQTQTFGSDINLSGGTTYTIRATLRSITRNHKTNNSPITLGIDNIIVNVAPVGLAGTAPVDTTNVYLTWTGSVGGSNTPGLHAADPYKVYRNTASPVTTFLANIGTTAYTDTGTTGNTTYYYAVANQDINSVVSPLSAEVSVKTRPGAPSTLSFSNIQGTSLTVGWTEAAGGADSYLVERCSGSGCSNFLQIASNIVGNTYPDSGLQAGTLYRYQVRGYNGNNGSYSPVGEVTTSLALSISLLSDGAVNFGTLGLGTSKDTTGNGVNDPQSVRVDSGTANLQIKSSQFAEGSNIWYLSSNNGTTQVQWEFSKDGVGWTTFTSADTPVDLDTAVGAGTTRVVFFKLTMPTSTESFNAYGSTVTIMATTP